VGTPFGIPLFQVGYIRMKHAWYMIEPVAGHDFTKETEQPHVLYKRSPGGFQNAGIARDLCNVANDTSRIIAKRASNPRKRTPAKQNENRFYTVELLVVLDKSLLDVHRELDVENYVLTLFNMVSLTKGSHEHVFRRGALKKSSSLRRPGCFTMSV
jgi:hypothetical protein